MDFYKILQEIMEDKHLSIPDVARMCGLTDSTVRSIIDRKQKKVALNVAFKMSAGLGVSLERLNGDKEKSPEAAGTAPEDMNDRELLAAALTNIGILKPGQDLTDEDTEIVMSAFRLLEAWFAQKNKK